MTGNFALSLVPNGHRKRVIATLKFSQPGNKLGHMCVCSAPPTQMQDMLSALLR